jgi:hypothetical protein
MDVSAQNAILAVQFADDGTAQSWFNALCDAYRNLQDHDWDEFVSALRQGASMAGLDDGLTDQFVRYMNDASGPLDTVAELAELGDQLLAQYQALVAAAQSTENSAAQGDDDSAVQSADNSTAAAGYDADAWSAFLAADGPQWNGDEAAWDQFRAWFLYQAGQQQLTDPATGFIAYVEGRTDKRAAFAEYGIQIGGGANPSDSPADNAAASAASGQGTDVSSYPETKVGDDGDWVAYLDTLLTNQGF